MAKRDLYDILGLSRTASPAEIKQAHRKLARKYHPDVAKDDPQAVARFQEVQEAYDVLADPEKRKRYDRFGHAGVGAGAGAAGGGAGGGFDPFEAFRRAQQGQGAYGNVGTGGYGPGGFRVEDIDPEDLEDLKNGQFGDVFEQLFGAAGPFGRRGARPRPGPGDYATSARSAPRPSDLTVEYPVTIDFRDAATGTTLPIRLQRGHRAETIDVKVPAGVKDGQRVRIKGRGVQRGSAVGDLILIVTVREHPFFRREGASLDILLDLPVSVYEAMLGAKVDVPTLDGRVTLTIPPGSSGGAKLRIRGKGVRKGDQRGDQIVTLRIIVPRDLDDEDRQMLQRLREKRPVEARRDAPWG